MSDNDIILLVDMTVPKTLKRNNNIETSAGSITFISENSEIVLEGIFSCAIVKQYNRKRYRFWYRDGVVDSLQDVFSYSNKKV